MATFIQCNNGTARKIILHQQQSGQYVTPDTKKQVPELQSCTFVAFSAHPIHNYGYFL